MTFKRLFTKSLGLLLSSFFLIASGCPVTNSGGGGGGSNEPQVKDISDVPDPTSATTRQYLHQVPCLLQGYQASPAPGTETQPTLWHINLKDGTSTTTPVLWPKGNGSPWMLNYFIAPNTKPSLANDMSAAIKTWYSALARDARGTLLFNIQQSNDPLNSQVFLYPDFNGNMIIQADEGGDEVLGMIPTDKPLSQTHLERADIIIRSTLPDNWAYAATLHEIGHSLGLNHSVYSSSVMYPILNEGCAAQQAVGSQVGTLDTSWLESVYDPVWTASVGQLTFETCDGSLLGQTITYYSGDVLPGNVATVPPNQEWIVTWSNGSITCGDQTNGGGG